MMEKGTAKVAGIIQARLGSSRLNGKVLLPLAGRPALCHVISRVKAARAVSEVIVATSTERGDDMIADLCAGMAITVFRGSEKDVLDRFRGAARETGADHIVRITADCPLMDPAVIDTVIRRHLDEQADYTTNTLPPTYPDGEDVEVFRSLVLEQAWKEARLPSEREHVTPYMRNHPELFKLVNVVNRTDLSAKRWTMDEERDYRFLQDIFEALYGRNPIFGMDEVLDFLAAHPACEEMNKGITRNEGYLKSVRADKECRSGGEHKGR